MILFSVVIPCFNEAENIGKCLLSLNNQSLPRSQFEVIVVDNGSDDDSVQISQALADRVLEYPNIRVGEVRNRGVLEAQGRNLVFLDADCTLDKDWLNRALRLLEQNDKTAFGGGCLLPSNASWIERCWLLEGPDGNTLPKELIGCSIVLPRGMFEQVGGFSESMLSGEDSELSIRLKSQGNTVRLTRDLNVVHWGNAKTQRAFLERQIWHAKSYEVSLKRNLNDPIFLLTGLFSFLVISTPLLLLAAPKALMIIVTPTLGLAAILTTKRFKRAARLPYSVAEAVYSYYLDLLYLAGRSIGLCAVILSRLQRSVHFN